MSTIVHFINVGQGNMSFIQTSSGQNFVFDCNITNDNENYVLSYVAKQVNGHAHLNAFICSHRDADHIRGVAKLHEYFPIQNIWDSDYPGTSTNTTEYKEYMQLRRQIGGNVIEKQTRNNFGRTRFRYLSAQDTRLEKNANAQGIVLKVEHLSANRTCENAVMLTGDSDAETWRYGIQKDYTDNNLLCEILVAGHHGSITFFDDPSDTKHYYTRHIRAMNPAMTIVSVGKNPHGHPNAKALELYEKYCRGSRQDNKVLRTDQKGHMCLELKDGGGWGLKLEK